MPGPVEHYLARYAESEASASVALGRSEHQHVVVIPSYGEGENLLEVLRSVPSRHGSVLAIVVVNARADSPGWVHESNRDTLRALKDTAFPQGELLVVDRTIDAVPLPEKQGVGLARKIGSDIALALWDQERVKSPFIHTTDADALLPKDYFARSSGAIKGVAALVYPFAHDAPDETAEAIAAYDKSLRYYTAGLHRADSPYAFHTVGSTLAIHAEAYAAVRGFPRREAGEDFYILNKLRKVGLVEELDGLPIHLSGRASDRVPFGTGATVRKWTAAGPAAFRTYHPRAFEHLRTWLSASTQSLRESVPIDATLTLAEEGDLLRTALRDIGALDALERARKAATTPDARLRHFHTQFDAFRTLKLVHYLRDHGLGTVNVADVV